MASNHHHSSTGLSQQHPPCLPLLAQLLHTATGAPPPRKPAPICPWSSQSTQWPSASPSPCSPHPPSSPVPTPKSPSCHSSPGLLSHLRVFAWLLPSLLSTITYWATHLTPLTSIHLSQGNLPHPPGTYCHSHLLCPQCSCLLAYSVFQRLVLMIPCQARVSAFQGQ